MRKLITLILLMTLSLATLAQSPQPMSRFANLSLFTGYFAKQQNSNENGSWLGAYGDIPLYRSPSERWNISLWGVYSKSEWTNNMAPYKSHSQDIALGLSTGYYNEFFSYKHSLYSGFAVGYKNSQENGEVQKRSYHAVSSQRDDFLVGSMNLNLIKFSGYHYYLLPRMQLIVNGQKSLQAKKTWQENDKPDTLVQAWNKGFIETTLKLSLVDIPVNQRQSVFLQPKIGGQFSHYFDGQDRNAYGPLIELALHKAGNDDFLSLTLMHKHQGEGNDYLFVMLNANLLKIFQKK